MSFFAKVTFKSDRPVVEKSISNFVDRAVGKSILVMERNIKDNTPILSGTLRRSVTAKKTGFGQGEVSTTPANATEDINYAVYVEYGTRHQAPRAMFRKGVAQSEEKIKEIFRDEASRVRNNP